jgi:hypothetical protein
LPTASSNPAQRPGSCSAARARGSTASLRTSPASPAPRSTSSTSASSSPSRCSSSRLRRRPAPRPSAAPRRVRRDDRDAGDEEHVHAPSARATSTQTIRSRVLGNQLNGNVGSSTFRFVLAALLLDELDLHPYLRGTKVALSAQENERLSAWQRKHLLLTSRARKRPWEIEANAIGELALPLNLAGNAAHAFYPTVRAARAGLRRRAHAAVASEAHR